MANLTLGGFKLFDYGGSGNTYILPVYTFKCPCDFRHYIFWWDCASTEDYPNIFRPKYLEKYQKLLKRAEKISYTQCRASIPHFTIKKQILPCEHIHINTHMKNISFYRRGIWGEAMDERINLIVADLKQMAYLPIGTSLAHFISNYWIHIIYNWYRSPQPNILTFTGMKENVTNAPETFFLAFFRENIDKSEKEIKSTLHEIMPLDLIKIIYLYAHSAADTYAKIILMLQDDFLKYGKILAIPEPLKAVVAKTTTTMQFQ
ncbi:MAG: hypothetical protein Hyperionvirus11_72 [Hyperionvirus sp.]|uniref:Uncharacterized protein n=1 Tax=Hyperionvirus sp. TaxID=2487770 RepID=A0A3G5AEK1_9VIRU|nr:MAG: hypothetical protein Hyperionvirus11_72 [Hyperionvirus sp.]